MFRRTLMQGATAVVVLSALVGGISAGAQKVNGAGATFPGPIYKKWFNDFHAANPGVEIDYQPVGSGQGIAYYKQGTVFFGATDAAMSDTDLNGVQPTLHIPTVAGAVVLAYNIPGVGAGLKLSGDVIADIYEKKITNWADPRIKRDNPAVPALPIVVVHRSDGSGTTNIFTTYLSAVSQSWQTGPGIGKTVSWPAGIGGQGNPGVANLVRTQRGAIGYVELTYALENHIQYAEVKNAAGSWVEPSIASTEAAAAAGKIRGDVRVSIVNGPGKNTYPIAGFTYLLIPRNPRDKNQGRAIVAFLRWAMGPGQDLAQSLNYARLPKSIVDMNIKAINSINVK